MPARAAHCIGCGVTFDKMHLMINHRRNNRCGGRFLPLDERELVEAAKKQRQLFNCTGEPEHARQVTAMLDKFYRLRKIRLDWGSVEA